MVGRPVPIQQERCELDLQPEIFGEAGEKGNGISFMVHLQQNPGAGEKGHGADKAIIAGLLGLKADISNSR